MVKNKNWFRKHPVLTVIFIILAIPLLIGFFQGLFGFSGDLSQEEASEESNLENVYGLNEKVIVGDFAYTLHGVETKSELLNLFESKQATGIFWIIDITVENVGMKSESFFSSYLNIVDNQGRMFESDTVAGFYLDNSLGFGQMQPGLPKRGEMVFDVPQDITGKLGIKQNIFLDDYEAYFEIK